MATITVSITYEYQQTTSEMSSQTDTDRH